MVDSYSVFGKDRLVTLLQCVFVILGIKYFSLDSLVDIKNVYTPVELQFIKMISDCNITLSCWCTLLFIVVYLKVKFRFCNFLVLIQINKQTNKQRPSTIALGVVGTNIHFCVQKCLQLHLMLI